MILAVASGKGGTVKTTVSVNLARVLGSDEDPAAIGTRDGHSPYLLSGPGPNSCGAA